MDESKKIVGMDGKPVAPEITDAVTIAVNLEKKSIVNVTITPGLANNPLDAAKVLFNLGMSLLENVSKPKKVLQKVNIPVAKLAEIMKSIRR